MVESAFAQTTVNESSSGSFLGMITSFVPLIVVIVLIYFLVIKKPKKDKSMVCNSCETKGETTTVTKGSIFIEIVLWCCFLVPGIIYSIWRSTSKQKVCSACGATTLVPLNSPAGKRIISKVE